MAEILDSNQRYFVSIYPDTRVNLGQSGTFTLGASVQPVNIPDDAHFVQILPTIDIRYNLGSDPSAEGVGGLTTGFTAKAGIMTPCSIGTGTGRILKLLGNGASVYVEWR